MPWLCNCGGAGDPDRGSSPASAMPWRARSARGMPGSGLGLAIVRQIAESHRGRIELDSRPGAGARFTLVVPVDQPVTASESGS